MAFAAGFQKEAPNGVGVGLLDEGRLGHTHPERCQGAPESPRAGFQPRGQRSCMAPPTLMCCPDSLPTAPAQEHNMSCRGRGQGAAVNPHAFGIPGEEAQVQKGGDKRDRTQSSREPAEISV